MENKEKKNNAAELNSDALENVSGGSLNYQHHCMDCNISFPITDSVCPGCGRPPMAGCVPSEQLWTIC